MFQRYVLHFTQMETRMMSSTRLDTRGYCTCSDNGITSNCSNEVATLMTLQALQVQNQESWHLCAQHAPILESIYQRTGTVHPQNFSEFFLSLLYSRSLTIGFQIFIYAYSLPGCQLSAQEPASFLLCHQCWFRNRAIIFWSIGALYSMVP